jgi:AraC family transcriptional regulator
MNGKNSSITFGEELKKLEVGGFVLTQTYHQPHIALPRHDHECANINFTIKGSFREIFGSRPQEAVASSILVKPAGEHHANQYGAAGAHGFIIEVLPGKLEIVNRFSKLFDAPSHIRGGLLPALAKKIYKEFRSMNGAATELMIEGLVLEMLAEATRREIKISSSATPPRWLREARDFLRANFAERAGLSKVAAEVDINPTYLARTFRKFYGCAVGEYVRRLQLEFAAQELSKTNRKLAEISAAAGFYDQSHFTNAFKIYAKMTPTEYRAITQK